MSNKKKIIRIVTRLNIGGPTIHTTLLTAGFNNKDYESILISGKEDRLEGDMNDYIKSKKVKPIRLSNLKREISLIDDIYILLKLYRLIKREKPDIVHTHTAKAGFLGRIASFFARVPIIIHTYHGNVLSGYFGTAKSRLFVLIEKILAIISDKLVVLSKQQFDELTLKHKISDPKNFTIIPLGFDFLKFEDPFGEKRKIFRSKYKLDDKKIAVGIVGRLVPIKNHHLFLDVVEGLKENYSNKVHFFIVGGGELETELREKTNNLKLNEIVTFCGFIDKMDLVYNGLDILALTSKNEGTPVTLIESMAAGKPFVSTNVGGVSDITIDGAGLLVPSNNINAFKKALKSLIDNYPDYYQKRGLVQKKVIKQFSEKRLINDMKNLYKNYYRLKN